MSAFLGLHLVAATSLTTDGVATWHARGTMVVLVAVCLLARRLTTVLIAASYLVGCDVLWRMTGADVPWEASKYLLAAVAAWGLLRFVSRPVGVGPSLLLVAALTPAALATIERIGFDVAFEALSFNLVGLVALALLVALCRNVSLAREDLVDLLWVSLGPILAVNTIAWATARGLTPEDFQSTASAVVASGGFGPNQVSSLLGLGVLFTGFLLVFDRRPSMRLVAAGLATWFAIELGLTFSRGGLVGLVVAVGLAIPHFLGRRRTLIGILGVGLLVFTAVVLVVIPTVQRISGDKFDDRFTTLETTLRTDIAVQDLRLFQANPIEGVGVGGAVERRELDRPLATHTEPTRLLAEHGLFGVLALAVLVAMGVSAYRRQPDLVTRAWAIALVAWSVTTMAHSATRIGAIAFAFALAAATVGRTDTTEADVPEPLDLDVRSRVPRLAPANGSL